MMTFFDACFIYILCEEFFMESMCVGAIVVLVIEAVAFAFGFLWAFVWLAILKPTGRFLQKARLLIPVSFALVLLASFWLMHNDLLNGALACLVFCWRHSRSMRADCLVCF